MATDIFHISNDADKPYRALASAIMIRAINDAKGINIVANGRGSSMYARSLIIKTAKEWVEKSPEFEFYCDCLDLNPEVARKEIQRQVKEKQERSYQVRSNGQQMRLVNDTW